MELERPDHAVHFGKRGGTRPVNAASTQSAIVPNLTARPLRPDRNGHICRNWSSARGSAAERRDLISSTNRCPGRTCRPLVCNRSSAPLARACRITACPAVTITCVSGWRRRPFSAPARCSHSDNEKCGLPRATRSTASGPALRSSHAAIMSARVMEARFASGWAAPRPRALPFQCAAWARPRCSKRRAKGLEVVPRGRRRCQTTQKGDAIGGRFVGQITDQRPEPVVGALRQVHVDDPPCLTGGIQLDTRQGCIPGQRDAQVRESGCLAVRAPSTVLAKITALDSAQAMFSPSAGRCPVGRVSR